MALDIVAGILLSLALLRGWLRGLVFQLGQVALLALCFFAARMLGGAIAEQLTELQQTLPEAAEAIGFFAVFGLLYLVGSFVLHGLTRDLREASGALGAGDRFLGLLVGGAKGLALIYLGFLVLIMASRWNGKLAVPYASSYTGRLVAQHNLFDSDEFPRARALAKLGWLLSTHEAVELVQNPHFVAILMHPKASVLREGPVIQAMTHGDWLTIMRHRGVWDLLDEPEIQQHLNAIEYEERGRVNDADDGLGPAAPQAPPSPAVPPQLPPDLPPIVRP